MIESKVKIRSLAHLKGMTDEYFLNNKGSNTNTIDFNKARALAKMMGLKRRR